MNTKHLTVAVPVILLAAICGQASARTANTSEKSPTPAVSSSSAVRHPENAFGSVMPLQAGGGNLHRYSGGPKSND
jgi:hypothetical protein